MIVEQFYLTEEGAVDRLLQITDLSMDEVETIVGRFKDSHYRFAGLLKGEVLVNICNSVTIRHHFKKVVLWNS